MKKNLFITLMCVSIIASMFSPLEASAAVASFENPTSSAGDPWGCSYQQYTNRNLAYLQNWGGHSVWIARGGDGDCLRLKKADSGDNWVYVGTSSYPGNVLTSGTTYILSVDYAPGPFGYNWPSVGLQIGVGGKTITFSNMDNPNAKQWKTFSSEFTATAGTSPTLKLTTKSTDIYLDNLVIKEKSTGNVVFNQRFDRLKTAQASGDYYDPIWFAETRAVPFYGITDQGDGCIGVIQRDTGNYAAYLRNSRSWDIYWRFSDIESIVRALPNGTSCKVSFDYRYCDTPTGSNYLRECMTGSTKLTTAVYNSWATYTNTFSSGSNTMCGFIISPNCNMCVDNFRITDASDNLIAEKDFDTVPLWAGPNEFLVEPATLEQSSSTMTATVKATNSYTAQKDFLLITAIYNNGNLESFASETKNVDGDSRGINHTKTFTKSVNVSGETGKTFKAFVWDGWNNINSFGYSTAKTIN